MRWPLLSSLFTRENDRTVIGGALAPEASAKQAVDEELRRWRTSIVPLEDPEGAGERRAKALSTIGAAMRQAQIEQRRLQQHRRLSITLSAAALLLGLGGVVYAGVGYSANSTAGVVEHEAQLSGEARLSAQSGGVWIGGSGPGAGVRQVTLAAGATEALAVGERVITHAGGEAGLDVGVDTQVQLHQQGELLLAQNDQSEKRLALSEGVIDVTVEPATHSALSIDSALSTHSAVKRRVVVETPNATVVVHGTVFSVAVARESGQSTTTVNVRRGIVAVLQNGVEQRRLHAGESWSSRAPEASRSPEQASAEPAPATTGTPAQQRPAAKLREAREASVLAPKAPPAVEVALDAPSSTLEHENGLFRLAIDARNNGDDASAVRRFDQLLATYPKSALAQEAKVERFRALKRMGRSRDAAREARRYLIEHGNGFAEDEARDVALTP